MMLARGQASPGETVIIDDITRIRSVELSPEDEAEFAHFTAILVQTSWIYSFDFRYQKKAARSHVDAAGEFFAIADAAYAAGHTRAFIDNAHSSAELVAKAELLLMKQIGSGRANHKDIQRIGSAFLHMRDIHSLLGRLSTLRFPARYLLGELTVTADELERLRAGLADALGVAQRRVATRGLPRQPAGGQDKTG
ncbi:hypothetical protein [Sorangium sp. So ce385]|uniref:hypothetical protein n=1 Tax=Sorangium sp. So ce385 TaxID=3133308 RepID=UPI003F5C143A